MEEVKNFIWVSCTDLDDLGWPSHRELCNLILDQYMNACPIGLQMKELLTCQGPVDFGIRLNVVGTTQPTCCLLSHNIDDSLDYLRVTLSVMHGTGVIMTGKPIFHKYFLLKLFRNWCFLGFLSEDVSCHYRTWELSWVSADKIRGNSPLFLKISFAKF